MVTSPEVLALIPSPRRLEKHPAQEYPPISGLPTDRL